MAMLPVTVVQKKKTKKMVMVVSVVTLAVCTANFLKKICKRKILSLVRNQKKLISSYKFFIASQILEMLLQIFEFSPPFEDARV